MEEKKQKQKKKPLTDIGNRYIVTRWGGGVLVAGETATASATTVAGGFRVRGKNSKRFFFPNQICFSSANFDCILACRIPVEKTSSPPPPLPR